MTALLLLQNHIFWNFLFLKGKKKKMKFVVFFSFVHEMIFVGDFFKYGLITGFEWGALWSTNHPGKNTSLVCVYYIYTYTLMDTWDSSLKTLGASVREQNPPPPPPTSQKEFIQRPCPLLFLLIATLKKICLQVNPLHLYIYIYKFQLASSSSSLNNPRKNFYFGLDDEK